MVELHVPSNSIFQSGAGSPLSISIERRNAGNVASGHVRHRAREYEDCRDRALERNLFSIAPELAAIFPTLGYGPAKRAEMSPFGCTLVARIEIATLRQCTALVTH